MWEYRWQRLQLLSHLGRGHVPHGQDAITGQINCNCEYLLESENFLHSSYFLEEYTLYHVNYSRQEKVWSMWGSSHTPLVELYRDGSQIGVPCSDLWRGSRHFQGNGALTQLLRR